MNGRKYGHNYAPRAHGFNFRARAFPVGYYAPKRFVRLDEQMWENLIERFHRLQCGGGTDQLVSCVTGLVRPINYGKTLGWWRQSEDV